MADERDPNIEHYYDVTSDQIEAFLEAKGALNNCPMCSAKSWMIYEPDPKQWFHFTSYGLDESKWIDGSEISFFPYVILACRNCGLTRQHLLEIIWNWLQDKDTNDVK